MSRCYTRNLSFISNVSSYTSATTGCHHPKPPNDLALNILARVPRQYHLVLSAVSKSIRFTLSSPQLYTTRSLLNLTENLLYFKVFSTSLGCCENWFAIYQKPTVSADPICNGLLRFARLPSIPYKLHGHVEAVVGHNIYVIGGHYIDESDLSYLLLTCGYSIVALTHGSKVQALEYRASMLL
ncbi:hypothetical protein G4B88_013356 [Cannabis sativa]|uniref:F-box domain-containing protein n=1 Tax=Cannabis sativa TaxID=3483 RepID=A0A7J6E2K4_CANSA|nr:hypothetical protein G4B88_013356 [Cannabis sativa]